MTKDQEKKRRKDEEAEAEIGMGRKTERTKEGGIGLVKIIEEEMKAEMRAEEESATDLDHEV